MTRLGDAHISKTRRFSAFFLGLFLAFFGPLRAAAQTPPVSVIRVMVLYTTQAAAVAGGATAMTGQINEAMHEANLVFQNSRVNARVYPVHVAAIKYVESGSVSNDLAQLQNSSAPVFQQVRQWRNQYNADLVCLITETGSDYEFYGLQGPSANNAYSILRQPYLTGLDYFPVALSFNFGCQLERPEADSAAAFPYAYGYSFFGVDYAYYSTVEAFSGQRLPFFSNPDIDYDGAPAGVPDGMVNAADNALVLNQTAPLVAAFRGAAVSTLPPVVSLSWPPAGGVYLLSADLTLAASASDPDGSVTRVDYYYDDTNFLASAVGPGFTVKPPAIPPGPHTLTAVAIDNQNASTVSAPVAINIFLSNDNFANRSTLASLPAVLQQANGLATAEPGEPYNNGNPPTHSVWWTWTATTNTYVTATVAADSIPLNLSIYTGTNLAALNPVNASSFQPGNSPQFLLRAVAGTTYQITADGQSGATGNLDFTLASTAGPANDDFANRAAIPGNDLTINANNALATHEPGETNVIGGTGDGGDASLWWTWTAPTNGQVTITMTSEPQIMLAGVYTGDSLTNLNLVTDQEFFYDGTQMIFNAQAGTNYQLVFDNDTFVDYEPPGPFTFDFDFLAPPTNSAFAGRTVLSGSYISVTNELQSAFGQPYQGVDFPLWFSWTAPATGWVTLGSSYYDSLLVYTGANLASLTQLPLNYQSVPGGFYATRGVTYTLEIFGEPGPDVLGLVLSTVQLTSPANGQSCYLGANIPLSVSYTTNDGPVRLVEYFANGLSVGVCPPPFRMNWTPGAPGSYAITAVATDNLGRQRSAPPANISVAYPPPANDNFANRAPLQGDWLSITNSNFGATLEPGEPVIANDYGIFEYWANSIWWTWTAPASGLVTLSASYDDLGVYTGSSITNLTTVTNGYTPVTFAATAGVTYALTAVGASGDVALKLSLSNLQIVSPADGSTFPIGGTLCLGVQITATEEPVSQVEYFANGNSLGVATNAPFSLMWSNFPAANYTLTAVATDNLGHDRSSPGVSISVRPINDDFTNRTVLTGVPVFVNGTFENATAEINEPDLAYGGSDQTVWYSWTAPVTGAVLFTLGQEFFAPYVDVYTGNSLASLDLVTNAANAVTVSAVAGTTYQIKIDNSDYEYFPLYGAFTLDITTHPTNDSFASAIPLTGTNASVTGDDAFASANPGDLMFGDVGNPTWYSWKASARGVATVSINTYNYALCNVYAGNNVSNLNLVASCSGLGASFATWTTMPGTIYSIAVVGGAGPFSLDLNFAAAPGNDLFANRTPLSGMSLMVTGTTLQATSEPGEPDPYYGEDLSVWYAWTAPASGFVRIQCPDEYLTVFSGSVLSNLTNVATGGFYNEVDFDAVAGQTYPMAVIQEDASDTNVFTWSLAVSKVAITDPVPGTVLTAGTNLAIAASTIDLEGAVTSVAFYANTNLIGIVTNRPFGIVVSNLAVGNFVLTAQATDQYGGVTTSKGVAISVPPPNDGFAQRIFFAGTNVTIMADNSAATREPGEPFVDLATGKTLWWSWTAQSNGVVTIQAAASNGGGSAGVVARSDTTTQINFPPIGSPIIPLVCVYTGSTLASLDLCASNLIFYSSYNPYGSFPYWTIESTFTFPVKGGQTYQISLDGAEGTFGPATMIFTLGPPLPSLPPVPNDNFARRTILTGGNISTNGTTSGATLELTDPDLGGGLDARTVWYSWTAPASGTAELGLEPNQYPTSYASRFGLYAGSAPGSLIPITSGGDFERVNFYALAGETYQIEVAAPSGGEESFTLSLSSSMPPTMSPAPPARLANGSYDIHVVGSVGQSFVIQVSYHGGPWITIDTDTLLSTSLDYIDPAAAGGTSRSYRVLPLDTVFNQQPFQMLAPQAGPAGAFSLNLSGASGQPFLIQASTNLVDWYYLTGGVMIENGFNYTDYAAPSFPQRFYRGLPQ